MGIKSLGQPCFKNNNATKYIQDKLCCFCLVQVLAPKIEEDDETYDREKLHKYIDPISQTYNYLNIILMIFK